MEGQENQQLGHRSASSIAVPVSLVVPLILAILAGIFTFSTSGALPVPQFYLLAGQVIPILMIAFALENRAAELLSDPQMRIYRAQLFLFLLGGEVFALLGASATLRDGLRHLPQGMVAHGGWSNLIAAGTTAGLVGGFAMLTVLALFWGPGWVFLSFGGRRKEQARLEELELQVQRLSEKLGQPDAGTKH